MITYKGKTTSTMTLRHGKRELNLSCYRVFILISDRARITSAAPIYFKPFYHRRTRRTYIDGALQRNNPIRVADEERRLIWREDKKIPDIVISLGTGKYADHDGGVRSANSSTMRYVKSIIPRGIRAKVATSYDMVLSTLDCEREWDDFISSKGDDDRFISICHRLDVGLENEPPKIDAVKSLSTLELQTRNYLRKGPQRHMPYLNSDYDSAYAHIRIVARRLIATLFCFDEVETAITSQPVHKCTGFLRCRLSPTMNEQFASLVASGPTFRVCQGTRIRNVTFVDSRRSSQPSFDPRTFSSRIEFPIEASGSPAWIEVCFPSKSPKWERISGY